MSKKDVQERTEPPTPRRLRKLREKGSVAKSKDLASAASLTLILVALCLAWPWYLKQFKEIVLTPFAFLNQPFQTAAAKVAEAAAVKSAVILLPLFFISAAGIAVAFLVQKSVVFSIHPILPKMERMNPAEGVKRLFSLTHVVEAVKAMVKTLILGFALYYLLKGALHPLTMLPFHGISSVLQMTVRLSQQIFLVTIIVSIVLSLIDVIVQKRVFLHENRMSKYHVKRDYKEEEGDPLIKSQRRFLYTIINSLRSGDDS